MKPIPLLFERTQSTTRWVISALAISHSSVDWYNVGHNLRDKYLGINLDVYTMRIEQGIEVVNDAVAPPIY